MGISLRLSQKLSTYFRCANVVQIVCSGYLPATKYSTVVTCTSKIHSTHSTRKPDISMTSIMQCSEKSLDSSNKFWRHENASTKFFIELFERPVICGLRYPLPAAIRNNQIMFCQTECSVMLNKCTLHVCQFTILTFASNNIQTDGGRLIFRFDLFHLHQIDVFVGVHIVDRQAFGHRVHFQHGHIVQVGWMLFVDSRQFVDCRPRGTVTPQSNQQIKLKIIISY